jgi:CubicO group peptidase (beta-lactamase class C family)
MSGRFLLLAALCLGTLCQGQQPLTRDSLERFTEDHLRKHIGETVGSASVVFIDANGVLLEKSLGYASPANRILADPHQTVYQIGSNSKLFVTVAAMQLYEQNKLDLHADIKNYLPGVVMKNRFALPVTMAQLLTHTSGVEDRKLGRTQAFGQPLMTLREFFERFPPVVAYPPGEQTNYSGNGMTLAAHVVEAISGEPFFQYVENHIYAPLAMHQSSFRQPLPDVLKRYRADMLNVPPLIKYPEGGMASTVDDMSHFLITLLDGGAYRANHILKPETVRLMLTRHFSPHPEMPGMGYGFFEANLSGNLVWMHTGDYRHISVLCIAPEHEVSFFLVMSLQGELREPLLTSFANDFFGTFFPQTGIAQATIAKVAFDPSNMVGTYRDNAVPNSSIEKFVEGLMFGDGDARVTFDKVRGVLQFHPPGSDKVIDLVQRNGLLFESQDADFGIKMIFRQVPSPTNMFISAGTLGQYSFRKIPRFWSQVPQLVSHLVVLFLFGVWFPSILLAYFIHRLRKAWFHQSGFSSGPLWNLTVVAFLALAGALSFVLLGFTIPNASLIVGVPAMLKVLPAFYTAACVAALPLPISLFRVWRQRMWGLGFRLYFTAVVLAAFVFVPFCIYWNLLGYRI